MMDGTKFNSIFLVYFYRIFLRVHLLSEINIVNLDFTRRAYGTNYIETLRVQIHANCRIRRVYFSDRLYSEDELPAEFKLYLPVQNKQK